MNSPFEELTFGPRVNPHASPARARAGFTLLEIVVAIAVVGLIMGITISQMDRVFDTEMKNTSNRLASTIRYLYNKSAMEGLYIRLVFDIDERSYWVEATSDPFILSRESEASEKRRSVTAQRIRRTRIKRNPETPPERRTICRRRLRRQA